MPLSKALRDDGSSCDLYSGLKIRVLTLNPKPRPKPLGLRYKGVIEGLLGYILGFCRDNGKENGNYYLGFRVYSPPYVGRIWGICGSHYNIL